MKRILQVLLVSALVAGTVLTVPHADAKKKAPPPITFDSCPLLADQAGRTYVMTTGVGPCTGDGITVSAKNVTIDLGPFTLEGNGPSGNAGIQINPNVTGTHIKHGTITKFGRGIEAPTSTSGTVVNKVSAIDNSAFGMLLGPATVKNSFASGNGGTGIDITGPSSGTAKILHSVATRNTSDGLAISLVATGLIDRSTSIANQNRGIFMAAQNGTVRRSKAVGNAAVGVDLFGTVTNTVDRVEAASNGGQGIVFETAAKHPVVEGSSALGNGKLGFEEGILINTPAEKASVTSTTAHGNFGDGIKVAATSAIVDGNTTDGNGWGVKDGNNYGINSPTGKGHNHADANDASDNQCVDDILC